MRRGVIATSGIFDVLHAGHVATLKYCRDLGSFVIVLLYSDRSLALMGNGNTPVNEQEHRLQVLTALRYVDQVIIFDELDPAVKLLELQPEIYVQGDEHFTKDLLIEDAVESNGGKVIPPPLHKVSSSWLRNEIYERELERRGV